MVRGNVSGVPYEGIVAELKNISSEMREFNRTLHALHTINNNIDKQTLLLELIAKKYNKKGYKKLHKQKRWGYEVRNNI